jgi:signal transduction histidine kinase
MIRFVRFLRRKCKEANEKMHYYVEHSGMWEKTWGIMLVEVVFYFMCLILICFMFLRHLYGQAFSVGAAMIVVIVIASFKRMKSRMERREIIEKIEGIVAGEDVRVEEDHLSSENITLGHAVNEIGEGIRTAVEKSVKDERLKGELLTNVSHDIKTPLTSIINYVDLLKKEELENEKASEYIEVLENKAIKLKNLIQDLIEVSKISTGNIEYEMMPINLHELIMQATGEYDEKFSEHCLKLIYNNDAKNAVILADSRRIWRVMENLLSNVYKYALEGTRVYVEVTGNEEEVTFTMKNISAKEINIQVDELTERFVRGDSSRTTEGSGLGLAIAQNLVIGQGGNFKIMVDGDLFKVSITFKRQY